MCVLLQQSCGAPLHRLPRGQYSSNIVLTLDSLPSQGAAVAAALIVQIPAAFQFAIFVCAALIPPSAATADRLVRTIGALGPIDMPTLHCVGKNDSCYSQSVQLSNSCERSLGHVLVMPGEHDIPRDATTSRSIAAAIERCAWKALSRV